MQKTFRKQLLRFLLPVIISGFVSSASADMQKPPTDVVPLSDGCVNDACTIRLDNENMHQRRLADGTRATEVPVRTNHGFTIDIPSGTLKQGMLYLEWTAAPDYELCFYDTEGMLLSETDNRYFMLEQAYPLPDSCARITLTAKGNGRLSGLYIYADRSDAPEDVRHWEDPSGKADLLFVSAHSDDEIVMMGGILPTYAGERGYRVQMAYMSTREPVRRYEALAGLKVSHEYRYPRFLGVFDTDPPGDGVRELVRLIRETRPDVLVTHDVNGEYNKEAHKRTARSVISAFEKAADAAYDPESAAEYGIWQAKKLYLHLWPENEIRLDFDTPLASFNGETAFETAAKSYTRHRSQRVEWLYTLLDNTYDCRKYGLYASTVGPDVDKNDLFEHIEPEP